MSRRLVLPALGVMALAAALGLALLAARVKRFNDDFSRADLRFEVAKPTRGEVWDSALLRSGVLRRTLAVNDDLDFRNGAHLFRLSQLPTVGSRGAPEQLRAESTVALERFDKRDTEPTRRSKTANLLAILSYQDAAYDPRNATSLLRRSAGELRRAIRLDDRNEAAKFNLELLLQLQKTDQGSFAIRSGGASASNASISGAKPAGRGY